AGLAVGFAVKLVGPYGLGVAEAARPSAGTEAARPPAGTSVVAKRHTGPSYSWAAVALQSPEADPGVRVASFEGTAHAATEEGPESEASFESRFIVKARLDSFNERFTGQTSSPRTTGTITVQTERAAPAGRPVRVASAVIGEPDVAAAAHTPLPPL